MRCQYRGLSYQTFPKCKITQSRIIGKYRGVPVYSSEPVEPVYYGTKFLKYRGVYYFQEESCLRSHGQSTTEEITF